MPKQFAFKQRFGNSTHIYRHERPLMAVAQSVNLVRQHIFTSAVLTRNQDAGIGGTDAFYHQFQLTDCLRASPVHFSTFIIGRSHFFLPGLFLTCLFQRIQKCLHQLVIVPGLHHKVSGSLFKACHC